MRPIRLIIISLFLWMSLSALAQDYPVREDRYVNDIADLLTPAQESELRELVQQIEPDFDLTVLIIDSTADYDPSAPAINTFATNLFNEWGIGSAERNTGVLILLVMDTLEIRIELGLDYGADYNDEMQAVLDETIIPAFREGDFAAGFTDGVLHLYREVMGYDLETETVSYSINHALGCDPDICFQRNIVPRVR